MGEDMRGNFWEPENNLLLDLGCSYIGSEISPICTTYDLFTFYNVCHTTKKLT